MLDYFPSGSGVEPNFLTNLSKSERELPSAMKLASLVWLIILNVCHLVRFSSWISHTLKKKCFGLEGGLSSLTCHTF